MRQVMQALTFPLLILLTLIFTTGCSAAVSSPAVIRGTVTAGDDPVPDLDIRLSHDGESVEENTNDEGHFVFTEVSEGSNTITLVTTIEDRECTVTRTLLDVAAGDTVTADIKLPLELKPPEVVAVGGVGYVAGDLNIVCE